MRDVIQNCQLSNNVIALLATIIRMLVANEHSTVIYYNADSNTHIPAQETTQHLLLGKTAQKKKIWRGRGRRGAGRIGDNKNIFGGGGV